jgi:ribonuclease E
MSLDVMRRLTIAAHDQRINRVELAACPEVAFYVLNKKRGQLAELEGETKKRIIVRQDATLGLDEMRLELFDQRDGLVYLDSLGMSPHDQGDERGRRHQQPTPSGRRDQHGRPQHGRPQHGPQRGPGQLPPPVPARRGRDLDDDRYERDDADEQDVVEAPAPAMKATAAPAPVAKGRRAEPVSSNVEDVEEAAEPMGEAPRGMEEDERYNVNNNGAAGGAGGDSGRRGRRRRGRRGRGGKGRGQQERAPSAAAAAPTDHVSTVSHRNVVQEHGDDGVVENEDIEATFESDANPPARSASPTAAAARNESAEGAGEDAPEGEGQPRRRRRRRGGRRHRRRKEGEAPATAGASAHPVESRQSESAAEADLEPARHTTAPQRVPPPPPPSPAPTGSRRGGHGPAAPQPPVVKTGSTDRHLIHDEPVIHEPPPRRPRTYRDLDAIPEDFD